MTVFVNCSIYSLRAFLCIYLIRYIRYEVVQTNIVFMYCILCKSIDVDNKEELVMIHMYIKSRILLLQLHILNLFDTFEWYYRIYN